MLGIPWKILVTPRNSPFTLPTKGLEIPKPDFFLVKGIFQGYVGEIVLASRTPGEGI